MKIDLALISFRLSEARRLRSVDLVEVATQTTIDSNRLAEIEAGQQTPSGDELLILANYYARDFRDFIDPKRPEPFKQTDILYRRHGEEFTPDDRHAIQEFIFLCEIEASLESDLKRRPKQFSFKPIGTFQKGHGEQAAKALRQLIGYGHKEIRLDIYSDFRSIGFHVFRRRLKNREISGLYLNHPTAGHCILINYEEDIYRQRFSASHEAAHAIFDSNESASISYERASSKYDRKSLAEIRANRFASCYLMPPEMLKIVKNWDATIAQQWAQKLQVSTEALSYALLEENLIDQQTAKSLRSARIPATEKFDPEAPPHLNSTQLGRRRYLLERGLSNYYVGLCFDAYKRGDISVGRLREVLLTDHRELREISILFGQSIENEF